MTTRPVSKSGYVNIRGVYVESREVINKKLKERELGVISFKLFLKIVNLYLKKAIVATINSYIGIKWHTLFGKVRVAKVLCEDFVPRRYQGEGKKKKTLQTFNGRKYFFLWTPPLNRMKRFKLTIGEGFFYDDLLGAIKNGREYLEYVR